MRTLLYLILIMLLPDRATAENDPAIVFDNRPEFGVPMEAATQELKLRLGNESQKFNSLTKGKIKNVRVRYFEKETWKTEKQVIKYLSGLLTDESLEVFDTQVWAQSLGLPEIDCIIDLTDQSIEEAKKQGVKTVEGRLLLWQSVACYRDNTGRWFFVTLADYFHRSHPKGKE